MTKLRFAAIALRTWGPRQWLTAAAGALGTALLMGLATVLVPNGLFSREIAPVGWNYPVWVVTSLLAGLLIGTYSRAIEPARDRSSLGLVGAILGWFAVGCPVCNKIALLALGYSGALTWFAPLQPVLAAAGIVLLLVAIVQRLAGQVACAAPRR